MAIKELLECFPEEIEIHAVWSTNAVFVDGQQLDLGASKKIQWHGNNFAWGYNGSGPAQMALALLLLYVSPEKAILYHQPLKENLIKRFPDNSFIRTVRLREHMARIIAEIDGSTKPELF